MTFNGRLTWNHDDAEVGVTAAAYWRARTELAEQERDEALAARDRAQSAWMNERLHPIQPRPLTADDVDWHMVDRARGALLETPGAQPNRVRLRHALRAALTEPPRPDGAEDVEVVLRRAQNITGLEVGEGDLADLADALAERGVRVTEKEN